MLPTSLSLLDRLRETPTAEDWQRLDKVYRPMIETWLRRVPGLHNESDDLVQDVLFIVFREIAAFEWQREGSFRAWLRKIAVNCIRTFWRAKRRRPQVGLKSNDDETESFLTRLEDPSSDLSRQWDADHDKFVTDRLLEIVRVDFDETTWEAFLRFGLQGVPAAQVAKDLGISVNTVFLAKSRILSRLRKEAAGLLD